MAVFLQLAPLHSVTNRHLRAAWFAHFRGFDSAMAPFILAVPGSSLRKNHFKDIIPVPEGSPPLVPQILGNESASFADSARVMAAAGYSEANWNLGCPYPMVAKKLRGSGLLPHPDRIDRFLETLFRSGDLPAISVKIRLGRSSDEEWRAFMPVLNRYPLASVTVHGRIGTQMYRGAVKLEAFAEAAASCAHPVVYNGDIFDLPSFFAARNAFPSAAGWMLGRGALYDPFLPERIRRALGEIPESADAPPEPGTEAWLAGIAPFHDDIFDRYRAILYGPAHVLDKMKEIWTYLGHFLPDRKPELAGLERVKTLDEYRSRADALLGR